MDENKRPPQVREIVLSYLRANGYEGICCENCGCGIDNLMWCDSPCDACRPAMSHIATEENADLYGVDIGDTLYIEAEKNKE